MKDASKKPEKKKLKLNRERIRTLTDKELAGAAGGRGFTDSCLSSHTTTGTCSAA